MDFERERKKVERTKAQYPKGTRIELNSMSDPYAPVPSGTKGTVDFVDDMGSVFMKWDNGRTLALIPDEDSFCIVPQELTTLKLYMPLAVRSYERDEYGSMEEYPSELDSHSVLAYEDHILALIKRLETPEESERGLMQWYGEKDSVNEKVLSARPSVEVVGRELMGVIVCRVKDELTASELYRLKDEMSGQMSDGWGESAEQREIKTTDGELYVSFWNSEKWSMQTEEELKSQPTEGLQMGGQSL